MAKKAKVLSLDVYLNTELVGLLTKRSTGALEFKYHEDWLENPDSYPISQSLQLIEVPYKGAEIYSFFENLLPDNPEIKKMMAQKLKAKSSETFDLLNIAGQDCVGAFQFKSAGGPPPVQNEVSGEILNEEDIGKVIQNLTFNPLGNNPENEFRISIAGAQDKTALLKYKQNWLRPKGSTPTSHIFKPPLGNFPNGIDMSTSVENEWLCGEIVSQMGIKIAKSEILKFGNQECLVVERFDRKWTSNKILSRIPQEDLCQALGVNATSKYESDGGPGIKQIMDFLNASDNAYEDRKMFLKSQVVFFLLAAIDGHGKNFSIFQTEDGFKLTPLYDILSAYPAISKNQIQKERAKLAMCVGKSRHYRISKIFRKHWLETAKLCNFSEIKMNDIITEVRERAAEIVKNGVKTPADFSQEVYTNIMNGIQVSLTKLN